MEQQRRLLLHARILRECDISPVEPARLCVATKLATTWLALQQALQLHNDSTTVKLLRYSGARAALAQMSAQLPQVGARAAGPLGSLPLLSNFHEEYVTGVAITADAIGRGLSARAHNHNAPPASAT
ncbi:hypothetical protein EVAR_81747_1 [Eumeta japonica]|uniref:Uncharacterized protein n=1 Tax=Eumeta variegata TaxID=151549 RepID=A0A4C1UIU7_EUMVA|nr:hypothetical protein EVAR_81747_1 [Eumeta japonica]